MSNFQALTRLNGYLLVEVGTGPVPGAIPCQGVLLNPATQAIYCTIDTLTPAAFHSGGIPFDADGRMKIQAGSEDGFISGGIPKSGGNNVAGTSGATQHFNAGLAYVTAFGTELRMETSVVPAQGAFSDGFSDGFDV